jgi:transcription antitermination factor NusA-like protein
VRMAARLTGWKIDVRSNQRPDEMQEGGVAADDFVTTEEGSEGGGGAEGSEE